MAQPPRSSFLWLGLLGAVAVLVVLGATYWSTTGQPGTDAKVPDIHDEQGVPYPDVQRISVEEAKIRYDAESSLFIDVRDQESYTEANIPGAILIPVAEFETAYRELPQDVEILTYCT